MIINQVYSITNEAIEYQWKLKNQVESGAITDATYSRELMKLLNRYSDKLQHILDRNYKYIIVQE